MIALFCLGYWVAGIVRSGFVSGSMSSDSTIPTPYIRILAMLQKILYQKCHGKDSGRLDRIYGYTGIQRL